MIIATEGIKWVRNQKVFGYVADLQKEYQFAVFIVVREASLDEMLIQLDELGYSRTEYKPEPHYLYYKVLVD